MTDREKQKSVGHWCIKGGVPGFNLNSLPRCQEIAKSTGKRCGNPAMKDRDVCCVHAGFFRPGAPLGNQRTWKHGNYTAKAISERREAREFIKQTEELLAGFSKGV